jgi:hypothetical protein
MEQLFRSLKLEKAMLSLGRTSHTSDQPHLGTKTATPRESFHSLDTTGIRAHLEMRGTSHLLLQTLSPASWQLVPATEIAMSRSAPPHPAIGSSLSNQLTESLRRSQGRYVRTCDAGQSGAQGHSHRSVSFVPSRVRSCHPQFAAIRISRLPGGRLYYNRE